MEKVKMNVEDWSSKIIIIFFLLENYLLRLLTLPLNSGNRIRKCITEVINDYPKLILYDINILYFVLFIEYYQTFIYFIIQRYLQVFKVVAVLKPSLEMQRNFAVLIALIYCMIQKQITHKQREIGDGLDACKFWPKF